MSSPAGPGRPGPGSGSGPGPAGTGTGTGTTGTGSAQLVPELDFRSAARFEELTGLIREFGRLEGREHDDQRALEVHTAKDFIFSMLGMVQKLDQKLPVANEYLLLSGGVREGVVDMDPDELSASYARGADYDLDFTLLVPALKLHDRNQPVTLDMRQSALGHSWLSLRLFDEATIGRWSDCCTLQEHASGNTNYFFSPTLVAGWFHHAVSTVLLELQKKPQRGMPRVEKVERSGTVISLVLGVGSSRMLYDIVPVVSFKGWPAVAQSWLMENHFWDGKITEEEVISGFYLVPACSHSGRRDNEWRLSFARSEVQLKKCISPGLMQAYQACKALIAKMLARPKAQVSPYHLRSIMLWACDRLPANFLSQDDHAGHFLLGLLDDLQHCLLNKTCPNYFIPQCNMLEALDDGAAVLLARKLSSVRSDPAEHLRSTIAHAQAAHRLTLELQWRGGVSVGGGSASGLPSPAQSDAGGDNQPDDRLAKKLQQLVTENPGKSISVFINPDDVTRPHFRIDDKFF
ncbi:nucleotidyltransferase MB21D2 [Cololabis saira]|uniref:nucleotidyltransferase MB21D2 n=1 Tax=Cololabis saira TaxID=129043 RepID=UPI002AD491E1|nr:nucleotidyltransferase MB21D2 [Cololabis saira]